MISQADLAAYWQAPKRHGFTPPRFDVRINEYARNGKFDRVHMEYVSAWTADDAKRVALEHLRSIPQMYGRKLGPVAVAEVVFSQPVIWS